MDGVKLDDLLLDLSRHVRDDVLVEEAVVLLLRLQTSATQAPCESSYATWNTKPGCCLTSATSGGEIWS